MSVANIGRRPLTIDKVAFTEKRKGDYLFLTDRALEGPRDLAEGKSTPYIVEQRLVPLANLDRVIVIDNAGRIWKRRVPGKVLRSAVPSPPNVG